MNRVRILFGLLCVVAAMAGAYAISYEPPLALDTVEVEEAPRLHALVFRYDTELSSPAQLERLMHQDAALGLRASAFPLTQDFPSNRNVMFDYAQRAGEIQLHARPMPRGLGDAFDVASDLTPYQYGYVDKDQVLAAYYHNLLPEIDIFEFNGFYPRGLSLHSTTNRLPWDDDTNYRIIAAAAARAGFEWISVTSQAFSVRRGPGGSGRRADLYDREITSRQPSRWIRVPDGFSSTRSILAVPTSWRDQYLTRSTEEDDIRRMYALMREDIDRHWKAARDEGLALVLLFHPSKYLGKAVHDQQFLELRRALLEDAARLDVPVMTFSEYAARLEAMR